MILSETMKMCKPCAFMNTRHCITLLILSILLAACAHPKSRSSDDTFGYSEELAHVDSLRWLTGGPEYSELIDIDPDTLKTSWNEFARLYSQGEFEAAYDYLTEGERYLHVFLYLRNSTAQYEFVSSVWSNCISAHTGTDDEYFDELSEAYSLVLFMTRTVVEMGGDDPYVPPHYMNLIMDYGQLIMTMKDYEKAEVFDREIYFAAYSMYGNDRLARFLGLAFRCPYLCRIGKESQAYEELDLFRQEAMRECSGEELEKLLAALDATERDMTKGNIFHEKNHLPRL